MKKQIAMFLAVTSLLTLVSCSTPNPSESTVETTFNFTSETIRDTNATTYPPATIPPIETNSPVEYEDTFESFMEWKNYDTFTFKTAIFDPSKFSGSPAFLLFRVVDREEEYSGSMMIYKIQIIDAYGIEYFDTEKIYRLVWKGHLEEQIYGRPPLEMGKIYARVYLGDADDLAEQEKFQAAVLFQVEEQDGKRYIYCLGGDLSLMKCKIPITDSEENCPYKKGKHDKAIAYLESIDQPLPTFDYKCDLDEFYAELQKRCP